MVFGEENYLRKISDIAPLFYDGPEGGVKNNNHIDLVVDNLEFRPFSLWRAVKQILSDWTNSPGWEGYSNNVTVGVHSNGLLKPNSVTNLLLLLGLVIIWGNRVVLNAKNQAWQKVVL